MNRNKKIESRSKDNKSRPKIRTLRQILKRKGTQARRNIVFCYGAYKAELVKTGRDSKDINRKLIDLIGRIKLLEKVQNDGSNE